MKAFKPVLCALVGVVFGFFSNAAFANPKLLLTELSSTVLTATLDGVPYGTVNNVGPDRWEWRSGVFCQIGGESSTVSDFGLWNEPGNESGFNHLGLNSFDYNPVTGLSDIGLDIISDTSDFFGTGHADGAYGFTISGYDFPPSGGLAFLVFGPVDVYFSDQADTLGTVPDSTSTLGLLLLSAALLFGAARFRTAWAY